MELRQLTPQERANYVFVQLTKRFRELYPDRWQEILQSADLDAPDEAKGK